MSSTTEFLDPFPLDMLFLFNGSNNFTGANLPSPANKLLNGTLEYTLIFLYTGICVAGLFSNLALIAVILGKINLLFSPFTLHKTVLPLTENKFTSPFHRPVSVLTFVSQGKKFIGRRKICLF